MKIPDRNPKRPPACMSEPKICDHCGEYEHDCRCDYARLAARLERLEEQQRAAAQHSEAMLSMLLACGMTEDEVAEGLRAWMARAALEDRDG